MRVLHVVEITHGGVLTLVRTFAELQQRAGIDVHLLVPPGVDGLTGTVHHWRPVRNQPWSMVRARGTSAIS
ncbi:hypothetical protein [Nocardioides mesophilus]|uniref:hypothetical protein n=1 Tax=Nocardioides mesophilus TaxID=433659 RepID=UPI0031B5DD35